MFRTSLCVFLVLSFRLVVLAETDYIAVPMIQDIQRGKNNENTIRTLRVLGDGTVDKTMTASNYLGDVSAGTFDASAFDGYLTTDDDTVQELADAVDDLSYANWKFPVFNIPLGDSGNEWTDFELKGSTNNFSGSAGSELVYFLVTTATNVYADDPWAKVYFTDSGATDVREHILATNAASIADQLVDVNSVVRFALVYPSLNTLSAGVTNSSAAWQYQGNTNLVWSYVRLDSSDYEKDVGTRAIWNPIVPIEWRTVQKQRFDGGD